MALILPHWFAVRTIETDLAARLERGEEVLLATVIRVDGAAPSRSGAKILLGRGTALAGTLGCSEFDSAAVAASRGILDSGSPTTAVFQHDLGSIEVYLEPHSSAPVLVLLGATPVARHLSAWAPEVGFRTTLVSDLAQLEAHLGGELYVVCTDHDGPGLVEALTAVLNSRPRFLGLMGSRRHTGHHLEALRGAGMAEADIALIHTPVGLDLGALTAPEIALSILAGLVAARHGRPGGWMDRS